MNKIYTRTIQGKKYKYERISAKREYGKVVTKDRCIGAVNPIKIVPVMERMSLAEEKRLVRYFLAGDDMPTLKARVSVYTGADVSPATIYNWLKKHVSPEQRRTRTENAKKGRGKTRQRRERQRKI